MEGTHTHEVHDMTDSNHDNSSESLKLLSLKKTPEYLLKSRREYKKRRYANDEEFRNKLKQQKLAWQQKKRETNRSFEAQKKQFDHVKVSVREIESCVYDRVIDSIKPAICDQTPSDPVEWIDCKLNSLMKRPVPAKKHMNVAGVLIYMNKRRKDTVIKAMIHYMLVHELAQSVTLNYASTLLNVSATTLNKVYQEICDVLKESVDAVPEPKEDKKYYYNVVISPIQQTASNHPAEPTLKFVLSEEDVQHLLKQARDVCTIEPKGLPCGLKT